MPIAAHSHEATVGQTAFGFVGVDQPLPAILIAMATLGLHLASELGGAAQRISLGNAFHWLTPGPRGVSSLAARANYPLSIQEDEETVTTTITSSALLPIGGGAVHVEVSLTCSGEASQADQVGSFTMPLSAQVVWMAVGGADPAPVLAEIETWFGTTGMQISRDEQEEVELPDVLLSEELEGLHERVTFRDRVLQEMTESTAVKAIRATAETHRRTERKQAAHIKQLQTELETARAVGQRLRTRAEAAERQLRTPSVAGVPSPAAASITSATPPAAECEEQARLALTVTQQSEEVDRLRAEVFRLREAPGRVAGALRQAAETIASGAAAPATLHGLASWAQGHLQGRIVVHAKAARAARKSAFADPGLVYRVLKAMAEHYWSMRAHGDASARTAWEAFLAQERLSCGPTGAAVLDRRTRAAYLVDWHRRNVELDQHIQGDSSRDEARAFRLYFHWDADRQIVIVGHLPSHLPNTLS